jgi:opacity protein-like surface antigen
MRAFAVTLLLAGAAHAYPKYGYQYNGLAVDLGAGVAIPTADSNYTKDTDVSFKLQINVGYEIPLHPRFLIAPELSFAFLPVNTDDATFQDNRADASFQRYRFLVGARMGLRFGRFIPYLRLGFGVDHITGKISVTVPIVGTSTSSFSSTAFAFEPSIGLHVEIIKYLFVGVQLGFPIASHDFGKVFGQSQTFTAFDVETIGFIGGRY